VVGILATTSFADPLCALCAPPSAQVPSSRKQGCGDHCARQSGLAGVAQVTVANCEHGGRRPALPKAEPETPGSEAGRIAADFAG